MEFLQPASLEEALSLFAERPAYTILAGGTDVVVHRRAGKLMPEGYLDVTRVPELREIRGGRTVFVGAAVTCGTLEHDPVIRAACPLLAAAAASVGSPQIRSRATLGGNVANASPAADLIPALTAVEGKAVISSRSGIRKAEILELVLDAGRCALEAGELILGFEVPAFQTDTCWAFEKIGRRNALAISRMNGAAAFELADGRMKNVRLCIGAATRSPQRFRTAEALLEGNTPGTELFRQAGGAVSEEILDKTGIRNSSQYKLPVSADFTVRLLENAMSMNLQFVLNDQPVQVDVEPDLTLLDLLRERLHLTGTKKSCGVGECGACTVIVDKEPVNACLYLVGQLPGRTVYTVEGLSQDGELSALQQAFLDHHAVQCGFCTPGMLMSAKALLLKNPHPTEEEIRRALSGNLCRCTGYESIVETVTAAAEAETGK